MTMTAKHQYKYTSEKPDLLIRMKKIEGQAKGVRQMIEDDRYCIDIVQQLSALCSAADEVALRILENHIEGCVTDAIREHHGEAHIAELMKTIRKAMKR